MRKLILFLLCLFLFFPLAAENFILRSYSVSINVDNARTMRINEELSLEYTVPSHGFYRDIKYRFDGGEKADINLLSTSSPVKTEDDGTFFSVRFGDPDKTVIGGPHKYDMEYTYSLGADSYTDYDEIYYNIVSPDAWDTVIDDLYFSVTLPHPVDIGRIWLTYGRYGSSSELPFSLSDDGCTISGHYTSIPKGCGVTIRVEMDEGYFSEAVRPFDFRTFGFWSSVSVSIIMVLSVFIIWYLKGRDEKLVYPVSYNPPEGLTPMDAGFIYNGITDNSAVSAMLIWWADKGHITITDNGDDDFLFTRISDLDDSAGEAERRLFNAFFQTGDSVDTKGLRATDFAARLQQVKKSESGYFTGERNLSSPASVRLRKLVMNLLLFPVVLHSILVTIAYPAGLMLFVLVPSLMAYLILRSQSAQIEKKLRRGKVRFSYFAMPLVFYIFFWFFIVSALSAGGDYPQAFLETAVFLGSMFVSIIFASLIDRRSDYADSVLSEVLGYREFMEKVEKDRIEKLSKDDPEFFYHVLPYAMVLGVENQWVRAFSGIYIEPVRWYSGRDAADIYVISSFSRRWNHAYVTVVAPQQSRGGARTYRGSSGFSGGGFSGGGGRSW